MNSKLSNKTLPGITYVDMAIPQIKRILTLQDRNSFSPTYGSFHRRYWLDKTDDFPDALPQFGVLTLALVYKHNFPNNGNKFFSPNFIFGPNFTFGRTLLPPNFTSAQLHFGPSSLWVNFTFGQTLFF